MAKVGDGTGEGSMPSESQGLTVNESAMPNETGKQTGQGEAGTGPKVDSGGNRSEPYRPGKK
jgi:hypothetical protein